MIENIRREFFCTYENFNFGFFERKRFLQGSVEILGKKGGNRKVYKRKRVELFRECTPRSVLFPIG